MNWRNGKKMNNYVILTSLILNKKNVYSNIFSIIWIAKNLKRFRVSSYLNTFSLSWRLYTRHYRSVMSLKQYIFFSFPIYYMCNHVNKGISQFVLLISIGKEFLVYLKHQITIYMIYPKIILIKVNFYLYL